MKKKILFIDRDGTLITDPPPTYQVDEFPKLEFYPYVFTYLGKICRELDFNLVMVTNQDGLGTPDFPEENFQPTHDFIMHTLENEGIVFKDVFIDRTHASENKPTRKPGTGLLKNYLSSDHYDIAGSFVIGDRLTDVMLAKNLGCKAIFINNNESLGAREIDNSKKDLEKIIALETTEWRAIYEFLKLPLRQCIHTRNTNETKISVEINLDGSGKASIDTGLAFFDHMLHQLARHGAMDLIIKCNGDLQIDEHHTIEDIAITLGEALNKALGDKKGVARYGFLLPMDDCLAQVAIDFGGRAWLVWNAEFRREKIGEMPTEMFFHFFKSLSDAAKCNLNIKATGENEHHKIESIFKAFGKSIRMAIKRDPDNQSLPTTKGII